VKVALVSGGTSGIGREVSEYLLMRGCSVFGIGRDLKHGMSVQRDFCKLGHRYKFLEGDVSNEASIRNVIQQVEATCGTLDIAVNCAGVGGERVPLIDTTVDHWNAIMDINLKGVWLSMREQVMLFKRTGKKGVIVNISSVLGEVANRSAIYTASKHGVNGLTKSAAITYASDGIRVNAVSPGYVETPMLEESMRESDTKKAETVLRHPIGRLGNVKEIANVVGWLCLDAPTFMTGSIVTVDGGYTAV